MPNDVDQRVLDMLEREEAQAARDKERRDHEHHESRLEEARRRIKEDDAEIAAEQARREAAVEAGEISARRHELAEEMEEAAASVNLKLAEYEALDRRHRDALRRAGRNPGHDNSLSDLLPRWFAHRFGGFNSVTGVPGGHPSGKERPLQERDPMASPRV